MAEDAPPPRAFIKITPDLAAQMRRAEGNDAPGGQPLRPLLVQMADVQPAEAVTDGKQRRIARKFDNARQVLRDAVMQGLFARRVGQGEALITAPPQLRHHWPQHGGAHKEAVDEQDFRGLVVWHGRSGQVGLATGYSVCPRSG